PPWRRSAIKAERLASDTKQRRGARAGGPAPSFRPRKGPGRASRIARGGTTGSDPQDVLGEDVALDLRAAPEDRECAGVQVGRHDGRDVLAQAAREVLEVMQRPAWLAHQGLDADEVD